MEVEDREREEEEEEKGRKGVRAVPKGVSPSSSFAPACQRESLQQKAGRRMS